MKVSTRPEVERDAKVVKIHAKCSDMCSVDLVDGDGKIIATQEDGYVPGFMPGGDGDYIVLDIDIETGQILNWKKPISEELADWLSEESVRVRR